MTRNEIARMRAVQDPEAVANWAVICPAVREALREVVAADALIPIPDRVDDDQTMEWLTEYFDSDRGRAVLAQEMLAEWRESPPADLEVRTAFATSLCGMLDELPGPVIDNNEQLSVLAVAVEALFAAIARVAARVNGRHGPVSRRRRSRAH